MSASVSSRSLRRKTGILLALALGAAAALAPTAAHAAPIPVYDSIPAVYPPSFPSLGYQATSTAEFGDHLELAGTERNLETITISLTSWACETGQWHLGTCATTPGTFFTHPVTLNVYAVDASGPTPAPGALVASLTQPVDVPYRPTTDAVNCPGTGGPATQWYDSGTATCINGLAFNAVFDFISTGTVLPDEIIVSVAFNTNTHGYAPIGAPGPYESLNVSITNAGPTVGTNVDADAMFWNTSHAPNYFDVGAGGVGVFRHDTNWSPYTLALRITVSEPASAGPALADTGAEALPLLGGAGVLLLLGGALTATAVIRRRSSAAR